MTAPTPEPRIERFEKLAYGMFMHWGLYSQLGQGEWIQYMQSIPGEEYARLMERFTADEFDAREIARTARRAGMKYITLTTRHHEGFSLYDTRGLDDFDAPHSPAGRDLVAEFVEGCRAEGILPVFYHTTLDFRWNSAKCDEAKFNEYLDYLHNSVEILCTQYGDIGGLWFDGNWSRPDADWKLDRLYGMIRTHQPEAMIVNNTGLEHRGELEHPEIDSVTFEQGRPTPMNREGMSKYIAAEMCQTLNQHWGIGKNDFCYLSPKEIIENLCACRRVGANYLLNVGPTAGGRIPDYEKAALCRVGQWVELYEDILRNGKPCSVVGRGGDFALEANGKTYVFIHNLAIAGHENVTIAEGGKGPRLFSGIKNKITSARWLDNDETLDFSQNLESDLFCLATPGYPYGSHLVVRIAELS